VRLGSTFNKEVPMSTTARRTRTRRPAFESLEGKVLLSTGMADPAWAVHRARERARPQHFLLNGTLKGIPFGTIQQAGIEITAFLLSGHARSMGPVTGSLNMADPLLVPGRMPDLSNAALNLADARGSVQLRMAASPSNRYIFVVTGGTGSYASVYGSGAAVVTYNRRFHEYLVTLHSSVY
jgi:hypothetical protein